MLVNSIKSSKYNPLFKTNSAQIDFKSSPWVFLFSTIDVAKQQDKNISNFVEIDNSPITANAPFLQQTPGMIVPFTNDDEMLIRLYTTDERITDRKYNIVKEQAIHIDTLIKHDKNGVIGMTWNIANTDIKSLLSCHYRYVRDKNIILVNDWRYLVGGYPSTHNITTLFKL